MTQYVKDMLATFLIILYCLISIQMLKPT